ncbi:MAG: anti-sigma factor [Planctomycetota bacterium]
MTERPGNMHEAGGPAAPGNGRGDARDEPAAALLHLALAEPAELPPHLADRLEATGRAALDSAPPAADLRIDLERSADAARRRGPAWIGWTIAAVVAVAMSAALAVLAAQLGHRDDRIGELEQRLADARDQIAENESFVASLRREVGAAGRENVRLAEALVQATSDLDAARLRIARYEQPQDPAVLAQDRRKLLDVPGTIRLAWSPFDLPDAPAEQQGIGGDVVWNDELEQGYLRFVGLEPNDPVSEVYQVWVIDERGLEQKVSGGVFNATAEGEIIVPVDPALDLGRVALFAVTVEPPGGVAVPDLRRRVVVAPREAG